MFADLTIRCLKNYRESSQPPSSSNHNGTCAQSQHSSATACQASTPVGGLLVALCCHHRCSWSSFVGKDVFQKLGFSPVDFHLISHMSSWAVCGVRPSSVQIQGSYPEEQTIEESVSTETEHIDCVVRDGESSSECFTGTTPPQSSVMQSSNVSSLPLEVMTCDPTSVGKPSNAHGYIPHPKESAGLHCKRLIDFARVCYLREHGFDAELLTFVDKGISLENVLLVVTNKCM